MHKVKKEGINPIYKMMLTQFLPLIQDKIKNLDVELAKLISEIELNEGETDCVFMLSIAPEGVAWVFTSTLDAENKIVRIIKKQQLSEMITNLINQVK